MYLPEYIKSIYTYIIIFIIRCVMRKIIKQYFYIQLMFLTSKWDIYINHLIILKNTNPWVSWYL